MLDPTNIGVRPNNDIRYCKACAKLQLKEWRKGKRAMSKVSRKAYITDISVVSNSGIELTNGLARVSISLRMPDGKVFVFKDKELLKSVDAQSRATAIREAL